MNNLSANSHRTNSGIELSIVMPCLKEADTFEIYLPKARTAIDEVGIQGKIIVAEKGSGSVLIGGIAAARIQYPPL